MADCQNRQHHNETNSDLPPPNPMPPPAAAAPSDDVDDRILAGAVETARNFRQFRQPDKTYVRAWKKFTTFVDQEREAGRLPRGEKYLTRDNVDLWFSVEIRRKNCSHANARRNVSALQYYANNDEHIGGNFMVDNSTVKIALESVSTNRTRAASVAHERIDAENLPNPYAELPTNNISPNDIENIMTYVLTNRNDWSDIGICLLWGISAFLRGDSVRKSTWCDIFLDHNHGAEKKGDFCTSINWILRKGGENNKVNFTQNRVVGCWRHREYIQCPVGILAMSALFKFRTIGDNLSFYRSHYNDDKFWRKLDVVTYNMYNDEYQPIKVIFQELNLSTSKVTHFRKSDVDIGGSSGLFLWQLATMMKTSFDSSSMDHYQPELLKEGRA